MFGQTLKVGVKISTHENPYFLRSLYSQILVQTMPPDVIAIFQNGNGEKYDWAIADLIEAGNELGIKTIYEHHIGRLTMPLYDQLPLKWLLEEKCTAITKMDQDDIFYTDHLRTLTTNMDRDIDAVVMTKGDVLENVGPNAPKRRQSMVWNWNPTGGMSDAVMYNADFAEEHYWRLDKAKGTPDDVILGDMLNNRPERVKRISNKVTSCYVIHGKNTSGCLLDSEKYQQQL